MKKALALSALVLVILFVTGFQTTSQLVSQMTSIQFQLVNLKTQISDLESKTVRHFYLTKFSRDASSATTACAERYHMASIWEILDTSNLRYNTELGLTVADSGSGPPVSYGGWVRTGGPASGEWSGGHGNCQAWTSSSGNDYGSVVGINILWNLTPVTISPWSGGVAACNITSPVWCVQD